MEEREETSTTKRDRFSALPVHIRHHILTYLESEFVKRDKHGHVRYIGHAPLGRCVEGADFKYGMLMRRRHRLARISRKFRQDYWDLFYSLNKFEFGSGHLLIEYLDFWLVDRRWKRLTSLRFTLRHHADIPMSEDTAGAIHQMRDIYTLLFAFVNLKELELRAQVYWRSADWKTQSFTFPVEDALSHFQGTGLHKSPISFGKLIEHEPRRHGYDEDPRKWGGLLLPPDLRRKIARVKEVLVTAYDIVVKEKREWKRREQQGQEQESRPVSVMQESTGGEACYSQRNEEAMRGAPADVLVMPSTYPVRCPTHYGIFRPGCSTCKLEWEHDIDLELKRSVRLQPPLPQASPQTSLRVDPSEPASSSTRCPNHHGILDPTCPRCTAEETAKTDLDIGRMVQYHSPLPQADPSEPLATVQSPTAAPSPRSHALLVEKVLSWLELSTPLYLMPTRDPNVFAYYLAMMEWAWTSGLEQSRIDVMTRAILARVDGAAFQAWLYMPSGVPDLREV